MTSQTLPPLPPPFQLSRLATSYWVPQAIHAAAALGVADVLAAGPRTSPEIASALGADPATLHRLMRALVTIELCSLEDDGRFALTPLGECLRSDARDSVRSWVLVVGGERCWTSWGRLAECVRSGRSVPDLEGRDTWVETHDGQESATFNQSMVQLTRHIAGAVAVSYDFSDLRTIVDVGGGYGALLPPILKANPALRGAVFDLPRCRDGARAIAEKTGLTDRYDFVAGDFFADPLPRADAYIVKSVIHDWDDERSVSLLRAIGRAMSATARLLIVEPLLPEHPGTSGFDAMMAHTDLNMLVVTGGRERTEDDFRALVDRAGLRVTRVVPTPAAFSIIEARAS
jgi:hypothetical protein